MLSFYKLYTPDRNEESLIWISFFYSCKNNSCFNNKYSNNVPIDMFVLILMEAKIIINHIVPNSNKKPLTLLDIV